MIKRLFILLVVACLFVPSTAVYADVVWSGNDFLSKNSDNIEKIGEEYYSSKRFSVNSPYGYIMPREAPSSEKGVPTAAS